ncbi:hypothetical protein HRbin10_00291 [bacterium HR10]|nr:hypothetical protein HRbin10_00291 [bacterium HR10]
MRRAFGIGLLISVSLLVSGATIAIVRWGKPLRPHLHELGAQDRDADGRVDQWEYRAEGGGDERLVLQDADGDGRADRFLFFRAGKLEHVVARSVSTGEPTRHLVLCLDGVPFEIMAALWREGHFREFFPPQRVISTFPADSDVALSALLHAPPSPGYENRYFDRRRNRLSGGVRVTLAQELPYHRRLDYAFPGLLRGPAYLFPEKAFFDDLARMRARFRASRTRVFIAHLSTTDVLFHVRSPEQVKRQLLMVEQVLRELLYEERGALTITLFSDHGNTLFIRGRIALEEALRAAGYRVEARVRDARSVVIPGYGLIGAVALYAHPEAWEQICRIARDVPGVELCIFRARQPEASRATPVIVVESREGRARLLFDPARQAFRYDAVRGDPLQLRPLWDAIQREGKGYPDGFIPQEALFEATAEHIYPDVVRRIYEAMAGRQVENPADLLLSLQDGYYFGSRRFDWFVQLRSTHGSLTARSSTGFLMSTDVRFARPLAAREVLSEIGLDRP